MWDYKIEVYRSNQSTPDYTRDPNNDADLDDRKEELTSQDVLLQATIYQAWWTNRVDNDGDGCYAGTIATDRARLNWDPDLVGCTGSLVVFEKVYYKQASSGTWTLYYTSSTHTITDCITGDQQYVDILISSGCSLWDYKIEVYRSNQSTPDYTRDPNNDADLNDHKEELISGDASVAIGTGIGVMGDTKNHIDTYGYPGNYKLEDYTRRANNNIHGHNGQMRSTEYIITKNYQSGDMIDNDNIWNNSTQASGVDAHVYTGLVYDYLLTQFGRNSFDNVGSGMLSVVEDNTINNNAGWNDLWIVYGTVSGGFKSFAGAFDLVAHEWGHAVSGSLHPGSPPGLVYEKESGALDESFSDMMGIAAGFATGIDADWQFGENYMPGGVADRDLSNPLLSNQPDTYGGTNWINVVGCTPPTNDNCGVHTNSGVPNKMFYLLSAGGTHSVSNITVTGIGIANAMKIMYRVNATYWIQTTTFPQAREWSILAANDLDATGAWATQVGNAWDAVNVRKIKYDNGMASWNMLSVPLAQSDYARSTLFPNSTIAFNYTTQYQEQVVLNNGVGYWVKYPPTPATFSIIHGGGKLNPITIPVTAGWNLVGSISEQVDVSTIKAIVGNNIITSDFLRYRTGGYQISTTVDPGDGYWIKVSQAGNVVFSTGSPSSNPPSVFEQPPAAPSAVTLSSPSDGAFLSTTSPTLSWQQYSTTCTYHLQVSTNSSFTGLSLNDSTITTTSKTVSLVDHTVYYWKVRAKESDGYKDWSNYRWFMVGTPAPPALISPANFATNQPVSLSLSWGSVVTAVKYRVQASTNSSFSTLLLDDSTLTGTQRALNGLSYNTTYYWRVSAKNPTGWSSWASYWRFTTISSGPPPDPCPTVTSISGFDMLTVTDANNNSQNLLVHNSRKTIAPGLISDDEMPPEQPPGLFSARFQSGKFLERITPGVTSKSIPIKLRDVVFPLRISWDLRNENRIEYVLKTGFGNKTLKLKGKGNSLVSPSDGTVVVQATATDPCDPTETSLKTIEGEGVPRQFSLSQNMPNPFNPSTVINYVLAEDARVNLTVHNVIGQVVLTLVNEVQVAGYQQVQWDAANFPSGVYFYRLTAITTSSNSHQVFSEVKKMLLMK